MYLRQQSTSAYPIPILLVSSADHVTPLGSGVTPVVNLRKNAGSAATAAGTITATDASGVAYLQGNAVDRNTLGSLVLEVTATGADPVTLNYAVVPWDPFDAARLGLTSLPAAAPVPGAGFPTIDGSGYVFLQPNQDYANAGTVQSVLDPVALTTAERTSIAAAVWNALLSGMTTAGSAGKKLAGWVLGSDNKAMLSTDAQTGVTIPTVTTVTNRVSANADQLGGQAVTAAAPVTVPASIGDATENNATANKNAIVTALGTPMQAGAKVVLAAAQSDYAPAKPGDRMDLVDAPNDTALNALLAKITGSALFSGITSLPKWLRPFLRKDAPDATALAEINAGGGTYDPATDSGEAIRDRGDAAWVTGAGGGGPSGAGAYTLTVTVTDGTDPLQNATVRYSEGASSYTATTDASGVATFALDAATYDVAITKAGYAFTPTTHAVSATGSKAWAMTAVAIPAAASPDQTNAYLTTYDGKGAVLGGVTLTFRLVDPGTGAGYSYPKTEFTAVSDTDTGLLTVSLAVSTQYQAKRGEGDWVSFTTGSDATYQLPEVLSAEWS